MAWWFVVAVGVELSVCQLKQVFGVGSLNFESNVSVFMCFLLRSYLSSRRIPLFGSRRGSLLL